MLRRDACHSASVTDDEYRASNDRTGRIHAHNRPSSFHSECRDIASDIGSNGQLLHSRRRGSRYGAVVTPPSFLTAPQLTIDGFGKKKRSRGDISSGAGFFQTGLKLEDPFLISLTDQSAHPVVLFVLYLFRIAAIATYILCGFFTDNYVVSVCTISFVFVSLAQTVHDARSQTVIVVVLLAMDFWNCRVRLFCETPRPSRSFIVILRTSLGGLLLVYVFGIRSAPFVSRFHTSRSE